MTYTSVIFDGQGTTIDWCRDRTETTFATGTHKDDDIGTNCLMWHKDITKSHGW